MMSDFGDKFKKALDAKNNDYRNFIWKGERKEVNGEKVQEETRLVDASQLRTSKVL